MAAKDSDSSDVRKQEELDDITTCCICTEVYTDPKALPCIHTFCMKCLRETGLKTNKGPGDEMPCPICRRLFKIPTEGFQRLSKHFFIERLIQVSKVSETKALCSLCLEESDEQKGKGTPTADTYCVECKHNLCEECCSAHRKFKATKRHSLIPITEYRSDQTVITDLDPSVCEHHRQNILNVYCADCKTVVCAICFIEEHRDHEGSHVDKCIDGFRKQIETNIEVMNECISQAQMKKTDLVQVKEDMQRRVERLECDVEKRKDEIKQLTDKHASCLLSGLCSERQSRLKEIKMDTDDTDAYLTNLESYKSYCQKIMDEGSASDICRAVSDLSLRSMELQQQCQPMIERRIPDFKFHFRQSEIEEFLDEDCGNLIGEIEEEDNLKPRKRSKQNLLVEHSNEIDILKKKIEIERMEKESFLLANEQLRIKVAKEVQVNETLTEKLSNEAASYDAHIKSLNQEIVNNKIANNELQTKNDKLKQEVDAEKTNNISFQISNDKEKADYKAHIEKLKQELEDNKRANNELQTNNDKLKQELDAEKRNNASLQTSDDNNKATVKTLETNAEKLRKEIETTETDYKEKILIIEQKHEQEKTWMKENEQLIKQLQENRILAEPVFVQTIIPNAAVERNKEITGLTILDKELFVASEENSEVEVYDSIKLSFSRRWNLKELIRPMDIGSCDRNKCLYIFDCKGEDPSSQILRVDPNGKILKKWSTGEDWGYGLSVTDESNVILTVCDKSKLNEYSPDGHLIREINLSSDAGIHYPSHAIKLTNGNFVVSHADDLHRVCIVDSDGKLKKSFGDKPGSTIGQMDYPGFLSVDGYGFVMVVDGKNQRVLLLDSDLVFKREILSEVKHGFRYPSSKILLDESNGRLFVVGSESYYERMFILIFELK